MIVKLKNYVQILYLVILSLFVSSINSNRININNNCPKRCQCSNNVVNCANQQYRTIPINLPSWTESLLMNDNPLETLSSDNHYSSLIISPNNLKAIDFTRTQLRYIDNNVLNTVFTDVHYIRNSLIHLNFHENYLNEFPFIHNVDNLRKLIISNNQINFDSIAQIDISTVYPNIEYIDLSNNSLKIIPKHFLSTKIMRNLTHLILNSNEIEIIEPEAFEFFPNLKVLKIARNNLQIILKSWLTSLTNLQELDLNYNQINKIDILAFEPLESLLSLKLRRNKFRILEDGSFWGLSNLKKLNLDHNDITEINEGWIYGLKSLKELSIKHNSIVNISNNVWNSLQSLTEINLNYNRLQFILVKTFEKLSSLHALRLANNNISYIEDKSFRSLKNLELLDMSYNKLSWTVEASNKLFNGLEHLKELRLDHNQIRSIHKNTFTGLSNLSMLNLTANPLSSIQKGSFDSFKNLSEIHLQHIELLCDCTMKWLHEWFTANQIRRKFARKIQCKYPHDLAVRSIDSFLDIEPSQFKCQDFLKPYLTDNFDNLDKPVAAIKNQEIRFDCKVATGSDDQIVFNWFKDNQLIEHERAIMQIYSQQYSENVTHYTNVLRLFNIKDEDQGQYHCMASNSYGSVYSNKFQVNVYVAPYFIKRPSNVTVRVGHTAKLECAAKGQPSPIVSWQKDGGDNFPAAMERRMHVMPADDVFFIVEVKKSDMGSYSCHATNDAGSIVSTAYLNVIEMPSLVRRMVDKKSHIGSTVSLECVAAGIPIPKIEWFKDGRMLQPTDRHFFTGEGQLLIIVKTKPSDQGLYSCNVSNAYGTVTDSSYLKIMTDLQTDSKDVFATLAGLIKENSYMFIIIFCVFITSIAWIGVICYIRKQHNSNFKKSKNNCTNISLNNGQTILDYDYDDEINSDSMDTGIAVSYKSNDDDLEKRKYHSLPRFIRPNSFAESTFYTNSLSRHKHHKDWLSQKRLKHNSFKAAAAADRYDYY